MLHKAAKLYLISARQAGLSDATLRQYGWHLERLTGWLLDHDVDRVAGVTRDLLRQWGAGLRDGWSPATVKQAVNAARAFFLWCREEGIINSDPGRALKVPKVPRCVQRTITSEEVAVLLAACDLSMPKGVRDAAIISLLVDTGLRAGEVCSCQVTKLDLVERRVLAVVVKGGREDLAYFGRATTWRLGEWLKVRPGLAVAGVGNVFVSCGGNTPGRALTVRGLRAILAARGVGAGLDGVTTHAFRRGFACIATEAGAPSRVVQVAGRWNDIRMVERYTQALSRGGLHERWSPADYVENNSGV